MNVKIESSAIIKPSYDRGPPPLTSNNSFIPLSIFDKITYDTHVSIVYVFRTQNPPNSALKLGLQTVLSEYREFAGRLGLNDLNEPVIFLNDNGVRFIEAVVESHTLDDIIPNFEPRSLIPSIEGVTELVQVQLTRFRCGSLVVGFTAHHHVADGHSSSNFLIAWGKASRGLGIGPLPTHDRTIFTPRDPPRFEFEHKGFEYTTKESLLNGSDNSPVKKNMIVKKVHFTVDFIKKLKAKASSTHINRRYSTFESLMAHLWRVITIARGLKPYESETTQVKISVNGRTRLNPRVPDEYFGNLVLWAFPRLEVRELVNEPLSHAAETIHDTVSRIDDNYFRSFIDFATHKVKEEHLVSAAVPELSKSTLCPILVVDSWVRFPFYDLDFGGGRPSIFMPAMVAIEGMIFLLPSFTGDGSVDAFVPLFEDNLPVFNDICYNI